MRLNTTICYMCKRAKELTSFHANQGKCKDCAREYHRNWRQRTKNIEKFKATHRQESILYAKRHPERKRAHAQAAYHKESLMSLECERCGSNIRLHMHHPDYSQPQKVITLCNDCHVKEHYEA